MSRRDRYRRVPPRRDRRGQQGDDRFLLVTLAQGVLCATMVAAAFVLGNLMGINGLQQAFHSLLSEETEAVEVFASIGAAARDAMESEPAKRLREVVQSVVERVVGVREQGGMGGQLPVGGRQAPEGTTLTPMVLSAPMAHPLAGRLTSPFGFREHPITGEEDFHTGIDLAAPLGTPILSVYPGVVVETGESKVYGNYILIDHGGVMTRYCHCERILARVGMNLRQGERVATVGSTGMSTGPHLHLELRVDGKAADPMGEGHWREEEA